MTYEFEYLMHLLGTAARGVNAAPPAKTLDWERLIKLAEEQMLTPMIATVLHNQPNLGCPAARAKELYNTVFPSIVTDFARRSNVVSLLERMAREGIETYVVKGAAAAVNYACPETRISTDTDICIDPAQEEQVCEFLAAQGCEVEPRWRNGHHAVAKHPKLGALELHVRLYDEMVEDVWFRNADQSRMLLEPRMRLTTPNGSFNTLGPTDHMIFMALHMIKHFILCGMSLRMMTDLALHYRRYRDILDIRRFWEVLGSLNYSRLISTILGAMIRYCGFAAEDFPGLGSWQEEHMRRMLEDVESGGWLGKNDLDTRHKSGYAYNQELMLRQTSPWKYKLYLFRWRHGTRLDTFFPGKKILARRYPWVEKHPWLIPAAWIHRLVIRGPATLKREQTLDQAVANTTDENAVHIQRMNLFRSLEML